LEDAVNVTDDRSRDRAGTGEGGEPPAERHEAAVAQFGNYLALLGEVVAPSPPEARPHTAPKLEHRFTLKLEYPDGSWDIDEARLGTTPRVGEYVDLGERGRWQVRGSRVLLAAIRTRVEREFFVCAYAGAPALG
jgi:hypothetical protein